MEAGLPYRVGPAAHARCRLDLERPAGGRDCATVVWFHGGGLTAGERQVPAALQGQGLAVAGAGYRLHPEVRAPVYLEDAAAAVAWVFRHVEDWGGARDRIFLAGASAGAYLALLVGLDRRWLAAQGVEADDLAGLISLSGQAVTHFTVRAERGRLPHQPVVDELAPLYHVRGDAPPILLVTGDREQELFGRYEENAYLQRMLRLAGHPAAELIELPGHDHGAVEASGFPLLLDFVRRIGRARAR